MAGANNRSLKAAGIPKATIQTLRVESGGRLSLKSAITSPPLDRQASR